MSAPYRAHVCGSVTDLDKHLSGRPNNHGAIVLAAGISPEEFVNLPSRLLSPTRSDVFIRVPGIIFEGCLQTSCYLVLQTSQALDPIILSSHTEIPPSRQPVFSRGKSTLLLFVDWALPNIDERLMNLWDHYGHQYAYVGAGVGHLESPDAPSIIVGDTAQEKTLVGIPFPVQTSAVVKHGWLPEEEPMVVTKAEGNVLHELNWQPAWPIYQKYLHEHFDVTCTEDNFSRVAMGYPLVMQRAAGSPIIRDPVAIIDRSALLCVGQLRPQSVIRVCRGDESSMTQAAREATSAHLPNGPDLVIDCVSRSLFLGDLFDHEAAILGAPLGDTASSVGILSIGEIATVGQGTLSFLNKSIVSARFL